MEQKHAMPIFEQRLKELRGDMSNTEFADFLGISRQTIGFYLNGNRIPDIVGLRKIAEKCNVSADWLLGISEAKSLDCDIRQICRATGLSEEAVKGLMGRPYHGCDDYIMFAPVETMSALLTQKELYSAVAYITDLIFQIKNLEEMLNGVSRNIETKEPDATLFDMDHEISLRFSEVRMSRFESIDFLTGTVDAVSKYKDLSDRVISMRERLRSMWESKNEKAVSDYVEIP